MSDFAACVLIGLMLMNLVGTFLVQRMLKKHHEQTCDEGEESV